jgi:hypothetical protein
MPEITIELDDEDRLPESFFAVLGTWEDNRSPEEIFQSIRAEAPQATRMALKVV